MKKILTAVITTMFLLGLVSGGWATEGGSLLQQTSFDLYDEIDPYDISLNAALLYQIDRWRLYTNLSNYEDTSDAFYLIGTSGKVGPGSLAFFYETTKAEEEWAEKTDSYSDQESTTIPPTSGYTGDPSDSSNTYLYLHNEEDNAEEQDFLVSYALDMGMFSLGFSYDPQFVEEEFTLDEPSWLSGSVVFSGGDFWTTSVPTQDDLYDLDQLEYELGTGSCNSFRQDQTVYTTLNHNEFYTIDRDQNYSGMVDTDDDTHNLAVASHVRPSDRFDLEVSLEMGTRERDVSQSALFTWSERISETGDGGATSGDNPTQWGGAAVYGLGYLEVESLTSTWSGSYWDPNSLSSMDRDTDLMTLSFEPSFEIRDNLSAAVGVSYGTEDGDTSGMWRQTVSLSRQLTPTTGADTQAWSGNQTFNNSWDGDYDAYGYSLTPELHFNYGVVDFSLGMGYSYTEIEVDGVLRDDATFSLAYVDGDSAANDADDWTLSGGYTGSQNFGADTEITTWSFPVATRFQVTDKLSIRAGAKYVRSRYEESYRQTYMDMADNTYTITDGAGDVQGAGSITSDGPSFGYSSSGTEDYDETTGDDYTDAGGNLNPYDPSRSREGYSLSCDDTYDYTNYRLGLGYQVTEHLQFDLMFEGESSGGGTDTEVIYASAVLAF